MTIARRLAALESSMSPTERIVVWLDEAHGLGSLEAYFKSLLDQPPTAYPINRLPHEAATAARAAMRGQPSDKVARAVRQGVRESLLRYVLVIGLNVAAHEQVERQGLVWAAVLGQLGVLQLRHDYEPESVPRYLEQLVRLRDLLARQVDDLLAGEAARVEIEARYLDGREVLFPAIATAWAKRLRESQETTIMADRLAELDGAQPGVLHDPALVETRTAALVREHVVRAKVTTLEKLDEERQAFAIANRWVRETVGQAVVVPEPARGIDARGVA